MKLVHGVKVGKFWIYQGRTITVEKEPSASLAQLNTFILGSAMGALLHQRGELVFHANVIAKGKKAFLFLGHQGAGKSTTAVAFLKHGFSVLSDDIAVVKIHPSSQQAMVIPGYNLIKLKNDSFDWIESSLPVMNAKVVTEGHAYEKHLLKATHSTPSLLPIEALFVLEPPEEGVPPMPVVGLQKIALLRQHIFRSFFIGHTQTESEFFCQFCAILQQLSVWNMPRPSNYNDLDRFVFNFREQSFYEKRCHTNI